MKEVLKTMLEHPIATWFVVGVTASGVATVIGSLKKTITVNVISEPKMESK